ncbi:MAG: hypothetical protein ABI559_05465 [Chloroflexota bacterium]
MTALRSLILLLTLVLGGSLLASCGGDDDKATTAPTSTNRGQSSATSNTTSTTAGGSTVTSAPIGTAPADNGGSDIASACDLLTKSEVEDALGESVGEPVFTSLGQIPVSGGVAADAGSCSWVSDTTIASVSLTYYNSPGHTDAIGQMVDLACHSKEGIDGLADKACWYDAQHLEIQFATGAHFIDIFATTQDGDSGRVLDNVSNKITDRLS